MADTKRPTLSLFPEPGPLSNPPTWEDIELLALNYPTAHAYATMVERGDITREQALIAMVHWFATAFSRQFRRELDAQALESPDTIVMSDCGCSTHTYIRRRTSELKCSAHQADDAVGRR